MIHFNNNGIVRFLNSLAFVQTNSTLLLLNIYAIKCLFLGETFDTVIHDFPCYMSLNLCVYI